MLKLQPWLAPFLLRHHNYTLFQRVPLAPTQQAIVALLQGPDTRLPSSESAVKRLIITQIILRQLGTALRHAEYYSTPYTGFQKRPL